jgi:serine phosphatase RsbU (regulator of sigma subunit)/anti-sigma regulatory factor (Ser/Thr protein kinase)
MAHRGRTVLEPPHGDGRTDAMATATMSVQGVVTGWSEGARRVLGYSAGEVVGRVAADLLAAGTSPTAWAALVGTEGWSGTAALRHRDGHRLDVGLFACPLLDGQGRSVGYVVAIAPNPASKADGPGNGNGNGNGQISHLLERAFSHASVVMSTFDTELRYQWVNRLAGDTAGDGGARLLGRKYADTVPDDTTSRGFLQHLRQVAATGTPTRFDSHTGKRAWIVEMWPVRDSSDQVCGVGTAAFDSSEQYGARQRLALLNEAGTRIGTTLDVVRTAEELAELVVPQLADFVSVDLLDSVLRGEEPTAERVDAAVVLRRVAHRSAVEGHPEIAVALGDVDTYPGFSPPARCLAAGRPLLSGVDDPDFLRWVAHDDVRSGNVHRDGVHSIMAVPLLARGLTLGVAVFARLRRPDPFQPDDLVLAEELAGRAAVCVDNARRYTREHTTALTLQRSLLPRGLLGQTAVEVAFRYLPAGSQAGLGGDWFDVVPLSGTRVALVVGDVTGHGLHASATMGSLRMAVRTLADVDLPPDELLTHLDDLVAHLTSDDGNDTAPAALDADQISATCLYAVYDPVSRRCTVSSAGHPPPTVLYPDGTVTTIRLRPGPPLGVGGLPFEATELELPEGSLLALYTDGLIETRDNDIDAGLARLRLALAVPGPSLENTCDVLVRTLLPGHPADDVALLVARTRALHTDQVATWGLPADPEIVADARAQASRQLAVWGLDEAGFVTELVVSELVTNAIRYGAPPIQLRLIRDRTLICEVSDGSNTAPHLRRARTFEEGGRGLLLVSQLTQAWGTRQTTTGKTIWAEQPLPAGCP